MNNTEFLTKASTMQREFAELYDGVDSGLVAISNFHIHVWRDKFYELEKEGLLEHISKELTKERDYWHHEAMTPGGVKIIALEALEAIEDKR